MRLLTAQEAMRMAFIWAYKQCPCCKRVLPDSRKDQPGKCELCNVKRVYVDEPIGWAEPKRIINARGETRITTVWMNAWTNRPPEKYCQHERRTKEAGLF